jgi:hypothetical protein
VAPGRVKVTSTGRWSGGPPRSLVRQGAGKLESAATFGLAASPNRYAYSGTLASSNRWAVAFVGYQVE